MTGDQVTTARAAGGRPGAERGESRWPMASAVLAAAVLHSLLPESYRTHPRAVYPVVLLALLAMLVVGDPGRIDRDVRWLRYGTDALIAVITVANCYSAGRLVVDIMTNSAVFKNDAPALLLTGGVVWAINVIAFALWYWDLDRGGPAARAQHPDRSPAFLFPEMVHAEYVRTGWVPAFVDYLALAYNVATAFSPTDVSALKTWSKSLMMVEATVSLIVGTLVIARAINVL